jgi:hypothetical protein
MPAYMKTSSLRPECVRSKRTKHPKAIVPSSFAREKNMSRPPKSDRNAPSIKVGKLQYWEDLVAKVVKWVFIAVVVA